MRRLLPLSLRLPAPGLAAIRGVLALRLRSSSASLILSIERIAGHVLVPGRVTNGLGVRGGHRRSCCHISPIGSARFPAGVRAKAASVSTGFDRLSDGSPATCCSSPGASRYDRSRPGAHVRNRISVTSWIRPLRVRPEKQPEGRHWPEKLGPLTSASGDGKPSSEVAFPLFRLHFGLASRDMTERTEAASKARDCDNDLSFPMAMMLTKFS